MPTTNRQHSVFIGHGEAEYFAGTVALTKQGPNRYFVETYRHDGARADSAFALTSEDAEREFKRQVRNSKKAIRSIR